MRAAAVCSVCEGNSWHHIRALGNTGHATGVLAGGRVFVSAPTSVPPASSAPAKCQALALFQDATITTYPGAM